MLTTSHRISEPHTHTHPGSIVHAYHRADIVGLFVGVGPGNVLWVAWQKDTDTRRDLSARFDAMAKRLAKKNERSKANRRHTR